MQEKDLADSRYLLPNPHPPLRMAEFYRLKSIVTITPYPMLISKVSSAVTCKKFAKHV